MEEIPMKLHEKIYYYRTLGKLSQEELAELTGVSRQAVSKWELGTATPEVSKLMALAHAFGVTTDELLSEAPPTLGAGPDFQPQPQPAPEPEARPEAGRSLQPDHLDRTANFLSRLIRRHGWLAGLYIAWSGVGFAVFGIIGLVIVNAFTREASSMMGGFASDFGGFWGFGGGYITMPDGSVQSFHQDASGNIVIGGSGGGFGSFLAIIPGAALVIGIVMIVGGLLLALYLRKKGRDQ